MVSIEENFMVEVGQNLLIRGFQKQEVFKIFFITSTKRFQVDYHDLYNRLSLKRTYRVGVK